MIPLISTLEQMDIAFVMVAVGMNQMCIGGKTVRDIMESVTTENFNSAVDVVSTNFGITTLIAK